MPVLSRFFGIIIYMYWNDHAPPHFHARYQDDEVTVNIFTGEVTGQISRRALALIEEWRCAKKDELLSRWECAMSGKEIKPIEALE